MSIPILAVALGVEAILAFVWIHRLRRLPYFGQVNRWPDRAP